MNTIFPTKQFILKAILFSGVLFFGHVGIADAAYFTATSPTTIDEGDSVDFEWQCPSNVNGNTVTEMAVQPLPGFSGRIPTNGTTITRHTHTFPSAGVWNVIGECWGTIPAIETQYVDMVRVTINAPAPEPPTVSISSSPGNPIPYNSRANITWNSSGASSCTATGGAGFSTGGSTGGSDQSSSLTSGTTFTVRCDGLGGSTSRSISVTVASPPPPTVSISSSPGNPIPYNTSANITWSSSDATSCTATAGAGFSTGGSTSGSDNSSTLTSGTTFTVRCDGAGGSRTASRAVTVAGAPNGAPSTPSISGPTNFPEDTSRTFTFSNGNDPDGDNIRYRIDWGDGSLIWRPSSGYTGSGNSQTASHTYTTDGNYTIRARTYDQPGASSGWRNYPITVTAAPSAPTVSISSSPGNPIPYNSRANISWSSSGASSCTATGGAGFSTGGSTSGSDNSSLLTSNTTFTVRCDGPGGSTSRSRSVTVAGAPVAPTVSISSSPSNPIPYNSRANISWSSSNSTSCTATGGAGFSTGGSTSGSDNSSLLTSNTTFTVRCDGPGGSTSRSRSVTVAGAPVAPTVSISSSPGNPIPYNSRANISWSSSNSTSCTATGGAGFSTGGSTSGSDNSSLLTSNTTFTVRCDGPGGSTSRSQSVTVAGAPVAPTVSISSSPGNPIPYNSRANITWSSSDATSCTATAGAGFSTSGSTSGSDNSSLLTSNTTFTVRCDGPGGSTSNSRSVTVVGAPVAPTVSISSSPGNPIPNNTRANISWSSSGASSCTATAGAGFSTSGNTSGSDNSSLLTSNTTFTVRCDGPGGSTSRSVLVTVAGAPVAPTVSISSSPGNPIPNNTRANITWSSSNSTSCTATAGAGFDTSGNTSSSDNSSLLTSDTTFTVRCDGPGGSTSRSVLVTVAGVAPTASLTATPANPAFSGVSRLDWSSGNGATKCEATAWPGQAWGTADATSGFRDLTNMDAADSGTYRVRCTNEGNGLWADASVDITVGPAATYDLNVSSAGAAGVDIDSTSGDDDQTPYTRPNKSGSYTATLTAPSTSGGQIFSSWSGCTSTGGSGNRTCTRNMASQDRTVTANYTAPAAINWNVTTNSPISHNNQATVSWDIGNALSCDFNANSIDLVAGGSTNSSDATSNLTSDQTFRFTCLDEASVSRQSPVYTIGVLPKSPTPFSSSLDFVAPGGGVNLTWGTSGGTGVECDGMSTGVGDGWASYQGILNDGFADADNKNINGGSQTVGPIIANTTFRIVCRNQWGAPTPLPATVSIIDPVASITALPEQVLKGRDTTVVWEAQGVLGACSLDAIPRNPITGDLVEGERTDISNSEIYGTGWVDTTFKDESRYDTPELEVSTDYEISCPITDVVTGLPSTLQATATISTFIPEFDEE